MSEASLCVLGDTASEILDELIEVATNSANDLLNKFIRANLAAHTLVYGGGQSGLNDADNDVTILLFLGRLGQVHLEERLEHCRHAAVRCGVCIIGVVLGGVVFCTGDG